MTATPARKRATPAEAAGTPASEQATPARTPGTPARTREAPLRPPETAARTGETAVRPPEAAARTGETAARTEEAAVRPPEPPARFRDVFAAEWLKLWSLRSTHRVLGLSALVLVGSNLAAAVADYRNFPRYPLLFQHAFVPTVSVRDAFTESTTYMYPLVVGSLGGLMLSGEYGSGQIRTTFAAVPDRRAVVAAKVSVATVVYTAYGTLVVLASFFGSEAVLSGRHVGIAITRPGVPRVLIAGALLAPVAALVGIAIGALVRHVAATIVTTTFVLLLLPQLFNSNHRWSADLNHGLVLQAWGRLDMIGSPTGTPYPATVAGSWVTYAMWPLVAVVATAVTVHRRDL